MIVVDVVTAVSDAVPDVIWLALCMTAGVASVLAAVREHRDG